MKFGKLIVPCLFVLAMASPAAADTTIKVGLKDVGGTIDLSKDLGFGMGKHGDMAKAPMSIEVDQSSVAAGKVTFDVSNLAKELQHEMLISPVSGPEAVLPFVDAENRVDEERSGDLGEVSELDPGKAGSLTLDLKPGLYVLYCNVPGHYAAGMWTSLTVNP